MSFLTNVPIDLHALEAQVRRADRGAVVSFLGAVRNHHGGREVTSLSYSAYGPMAEKMCEAITAQAMERWPVTVALAHRTGELAIGEDAVAVYVAGGHRDEAFAACRWIIEELKARVPIWKRERYVDGSEAWVDPTATSGTVEVQR